MKYMVEKGKMVVKKWDFGGKNRIIGLLKRGAGNQTRKAKWYKMQVLRLKTDETEGEKV